MVAFYWGTPEASVLDVLTHRNLFVRDAFPETFIVNVCWDDDRSLGEVAQALYGEPTVEDIMPNLAVPPTYNRQRYEWITETMLAGRDLPWLHQW